MYVLFLMRWVISNVYETKLGIMEELMLSLRAIKSRLRILNYRLDQECIGHKFLDMRIKGLWLDKG